ADTAALETYSDANAVDARYGAARAKTKVVGTDSIDRMASRVVIELNDGRTLESMDDVGVHAADVAGQWDKLSAKFQSLTVPVVGKERAGKLAREIAGLDQADDIKALMEAAKQG
ncbi:MAG TPA: hypothetical protein VMX97_16695, partial [Hyphomicrobiaceae bacterium]|nr:hypothetical protein [Hyphomicrobiaceae bacterium]